MTFFRTAKKLAPTVGLVGSAAFWSVFAFNYEFEETRLKRKEAKYDELGLKHKRVEHYGSLNSCPYVYTTVELVEDSTPVNVESKQTPSP